MNQTQITKDSELQKHENFTTQEAADFLRISDVSLWRARKQGLITFRRILGKVIFTRSDLDTFLERSKRGGARAA